MTTTAIIVAAGSGSRFNSETPKQFLDLLGRPVVAHSIARFIEAPSVDAVVLVVANQQLEKYAPKSFSKPFLIAEGGATRAHSVLNGLQAVPAGTTIVAVHDGARPLVSVAEIERVIETAKQTGAACLVAPITDTIKSINDGKIDATLDRTKLRRALTPQAFDLALLKRAFENAELSDNVTDECFLVERLGRGIAIVEGSSRNIKITHADDLVLAKALLKQNA